MENKEITRYYLIRHDDSDNSVLISYKYDPASTKMVDGETEVLWKSPLQANLQDDEDCCGHDPEDEYADFEEWIEDNVEYDLTHGQAHVFEDDEVTKERADEIMKNWHE